MKTNFLALIFILFASGLASANSSVPSFSGQVENHSQYNTDSLSIKVSWYCNVSFPENQGCGIVSQLTQLKADGQFTTPVFSVPSTHFGEVTGIMFELVTPQGTYNITDDTDKNFRTKISHPLFYLLDSVNLIPLLKNGKDAKLWLQNEAPHSEVSLNVSVQGGTNQERDIFTDIQSFPIHISEIGFIFTSAEDLAKGISVEYEFQSSIFNTRGAPKTVIADLKYEGAPKPDALKNFENFQIDSDIINTNIDGHWIGNLIFDSSYTTKTKLALSYADIDAHLTCKQGILSGDINVKYQQPDDPPALSKNIKIQGLCTKGNARFTATIPIKEYLGPKFFETPINFSFKKSIATYTSYAEMTNPTDAQFMGTLNLDRNQ